MQLEGLEDELKNLREIGGGGSYQMMPLPEGMPLSSSEVIASLNEHLVVTLQVLLFCLICPCTVSEVNCNINATKSTINMSDPQL